MNFALLTSDAAQDWASITAWWRDDLRWIWLLLGLILLITLLTLFYMHHHHRTYIDNCNVAPQPTTVVHEHVYRDNCSTIGELNDRLNRGVISQADYDRIKTSNNW